MTRNRFLIQLVILLALLISSPALAQQLRIYHIDVNQADATLFVSPGGHTLLVDSGKNGAGDELRAVMQTAGVTQIDHFVLTHYHEDHMGGGVGRSSPIFRPCSCIGATKNPHRRTISPEPGPVSGCCTPHCSSRRNEAHPSGVLLVACKGGALRVRRQARRLAER
jgi:hypothetical protein